MADPPPARHRLQRSQTAYKHFIGDMKDDIGPSRRNGAVKIRTDKPAATGLSAAGRLSGRARRSRLTETCGRDVTRDVRRAA